jgi:hypothetical protein
VEAPEGYSVSLEEGIGKVEKHGEKITDRMEKAFDSHVQYFEKNVLQPFCDAHNLRFSSAMGCYGFCTPGGHVLDDPREMTERHEQATNQVQFVNDPVYRDRGPQRRQSAEYRDWEPTFHTTYRSVWELLEQEFGNFVVGFSANDYNSPGYEKNLKKIKARAEG